jgi:hypothetical protein
MSEFPKIELLDELVHGDGGGSVFSMTVAEAGLPEDTQRGWRRALFLVLSDGEKPPAGRHAKNRVVAEYALRDRARDMKLHRQ